MMPSLPSVTAIWLRWVLATAVGFGLSIGLAAIIEFQMMAGCEHDCGIKVGIPFVILVIPFSLLLGGTLAGVMQRMLVLKRMMPRGSGWWVALSAAGFLGFWLPFWLGDIYELRGLYPLTVMIVPGATVGLIQWAFLRTILPRAGWWVPASVLAYGPSSLWWGDYVNLAGELVLIFGIGIGIWTSAIGGAIMAWLIRDRLRSGAEISSVD